MSVRILCATDKEEIFDLLKLSLSGLNIEFIKCTNVALALYLAQKNMPCLIVSGTILADGNYEDLYREIYSEPSLKYLPFVLLQEQNTEPDIYCKDINLAIDLILAYPENINVWRLKITPFLKEHVDNRCLETTE